MIRSLFFGLALAASLTVAHAAPATPKPRAGAGASSSGNSSATRGATRGAGAAAATPKPGSAAGARGAAKATPAPANGTAAAGAATDPNAPKGPLKIVIAGDSTAAQFDPNQEYHGWGEYLQDHFASDQVVVVNMARKGRTARSYIDQGVWKSALKEKPDFVLIQFGHNELNAVMKDPAGQLTQVREYKKYLSALVDTARKSGATPVLLTPTHVMTFLGTKPADALGPFVETTRQLAESRMVPLMDIHTACERLYAALGPVKTKPLMARADDPVHFGRAGAWTVASIVAKQLSQVDPKLAAAAKEVTETGMGEIQNPIPAAAVATP